MSVTILDHMATHGFEEIQALHDRRSGLRAFLGIHDTRRGPAFGGVRRWSYTDESSALRDVIRLARAMTAKCALVDLPVGGGKIVMLDHEGLDRREAYRALGRAIESLGGRYYAGPDVGTSFEDLEAMCSETTRCTSPGPDGPGELTASTCEGVFRGMGAALQHIDGEIDWPHRRVVVQGLGAVGRGVARRLLEAGATVLGADTNRDAALLAERELSLELVDPATEYDQECDVFSPCAMGGIVHDLTLRRLRCRVVAGAANNVLATREHGEALHERGVLFAPDIVITSGAVVRGALFHLEGRRVEPEEIGDRIEASLRGVLELSRARSMPPEQVAQEEAEIRMAEAGI